MATRIRHKSLRLALARPQRGPKSKVVQVRLTSAELEKLRKTAKGLKATMSEILRALIEMEL